MSRNVGVIGLGAMGLGVARSLLRAGLLPSEESAVMRELITRLKGGG